MSSEPVQSLYVHVPFCARKCAYCAFYSEASSAALIDRFVRVLEGQLQALPRPLSVRTLFFGGGTPSLLTLAQWERLLRALASLRPSGEREWTVECNPATVSLDKARLLRAGGINRISMGVQSLDDRVLALLGRVHSRQTALKSLQVLRKAGFENINLDLIFAIPGQTLGQWRQTLSETVALGCEHLSCYELTYEEDTPFFAQLMAGQLRKEEDLACDMYEELLAQTAQAGLVQYEVSNFARNPRLTPPSASAEVPSRACQHNVNYWRGGSFFALGPSASGYREGVRTRNWADTQRYCEQVEQGLSPVESSEKLAPEARAGEIAAFGLRLVSGWPFEKFSAVTGFDLRQGWQREMDQLVTQGWGRQDAHRFQLTAQGLRFADAAAQLFLR